jgi:hypothetical protein
MNPSYHRPAPLPIGWRNMSWKEKKIYTKNLVKSHSIEDPRDRLRIWLNDDPQDIADLITNCNFKHQWFSTYTFSSIPRIDDRPMTIEGMMGKMARFYRQLANDTGSPVFPLIFIPPTTRRMHFHVIECFQKEVELRPNPLSWWDLWKVDWMQHGKEIRSTDAGFTKHERLDPRSPADFYCSMKHIQEVFHKPFLPRHYSKRGISPILFDSDIKQQYSHTRIVRAQR